MQMIWETWFKSSWTHFLFAAGFARARLGVVQEEESVSPDLHLWHTSQPPEPGGAWHG